MVEWQVGEKEVGSNPVNHMRLTQSTIHWVALVK